MARPSTSICYAVDASGSRLRVVRAVRRGRSVKAEEAVLSVPPDGPFAVRMRDELAAGRAVAVAALPSHDMFSRRLATPFASLPKARRVLPSLLDVQLPIPLEQCVALYADLHVAGSGRAEALALTARADDVRAFVAKLAGLGVEPVVVDAEAIALWRGSIAEVPVPSGRTRIVVHLGDAATSLVVGRDEHLLAAHGVRLPAAGAEERRACGARLQQALRNASIDGAVELAVCGPLAAQDGADGLLRDLLQVTPETPVIVHRAPEFLVARAAAARFLLGELAEENFRQGALAHPWGAREARRGDRRLAVAGLAAGLLLLAGSAGLSSWQSRAVAALQDRLGSEARAMAGTARIPRGQEVLVATRALAERADAVTPLAAYATGRTARLWDLLVRHAAATGMTIDSIALRRDELAVRGDAASWSACETLAEVVRNQGWKVTIEKQGDESSGRVGYSLRGTS